MMAPIAGAILIFTAAFLYVGLRAIDTWRTIHGLDVRHELHLDNKE